MKERLMQVKEEAAQSKRVGRGCRMLAGCWDAFLPNRRLVKLRWRVRCTPYCIGYSGGLILIQGGFKGDQQAKIAWSAAKTNFPDPWSAPCLVGAVSASL